MSEKKRERIYLQVSGDPADGTVTWCEDLIYDDDVAYVLESELEAVKKERDEAVELINYFVKRCEEGSIRSRTTYGKYRDFLSTISKEKEG
jgi:hypothetical protein